MGCCGTLPCQPMCQHNCTHIHLQPYVTHYQTYGNLNCHVLGYLLEYLHIILGPVVLMKLHVGKSMNSNLCGIKLSV